MRTVALDALLPEDHQARLVWEYVGGLDLGPLYGPIRAVEGHAGRDAIDPKILMALWLYATLDGVGAARQLDRLEFGGHHMQLVDHFLCFSGLGRGLRRASGGREGVQAWQ